MMESESCFITTKNRFINQSSSLHFEQKISLNGHCDGLPPRSNNNSQTSQNGENEHKRWSTSYSQRIDVSDNSITSQRYNQDDFNPKESKLPSYVGISCTISGYSSYNRYCSSVRGSVSRGSSPIMRNHEVIDGPNVVQHHLSHRHHDHDHFHHQHNNNNHSHLDSSNRHQNQPHQRQSLITTISSNNWSNENNGGILDHTHIRNHDLICDDSEYDGDTSESSEKSLVQRRIESLYGSNVAEVWRDSRSKVKKVDKKKIEMINHRSPSCPPHVLRSKECKKSPAVFSHLNEKFLSQIDSDPKEPLNGLIDSLNEVLRVNGTKQNGMQLARENGFHPNDTNGHYHTNNHHHHSETNINENGLEQHISDDCMGEDRVDKDVVKKDDGLIGADQDVKSGEMYLKKYEEAVNKIKAQVKKTEKILAEESHLMTEEMTGNLLSSIGKGNLLIAQKLKQFRELCHQNINGNNNEQFSTKNEDLDGFWEMICIQIEEVLSGFEEIYKLQQNNWTINESNKITQPKNRSPRKISSKVSSPKQQKNTARDEMRKQRLREAKLKNQSRIQEKKDEEDIVIFVSSSNDNVLINNGRKTES